MAARGPVASATTARAGGPRTGGPRGDGPRGEAPWRRSDVPAAGGARPPRPAGRASYGASRDGDSARSDRPAGRGSYGADRPAGGRSSGARSYGDRPAGGPLVKRSLRWGPGRRTARDGDARTWGPPRRPRPPQDAPVLSGIDRLPGVAQVPARWARRGPGRPFRGPAWERVYRGNAPRSAAARTGSLPDIPASITVDQLDPAAAAELRTLPSDLASVVARRLLAASLADDPEVSYQHAQEARRLAARVGIVRETTGIAAYRAGHWAEALAELRAARRLTGRTSYLPLMADWNGPWAGSTAPWA